jgi:hypothetical protein
MQIYFSIFRRCEGSQLIRQFELSIYFIGKVCSFERYFIAITMEYSGNIFRPMISSILLQAQYLALLGKKRKKYTFNQITNRCAILFVENHPNNYSLELSSSCPNTVSGLISFDSTCSLSSSSSFIVLLSCS